MSNILIITDLPLYPHNENKVLAGPTISVTTVFAGDIVDKKLHAMSAKSMRYDKILHPATITTDTPGAKDIFDFIYDIRENSKGCSISIYGNKY